MIKIKEVTYYLGKMIANVILTNYVRISSDNFSEIKLQFLDRNESFKLKYEQNSPYNVFSNDLQGILAIIINLYDNLLDGDVYLFQILDNKI